MAKFYRSAHSRATLKILAESNVRVRTNPLTGNVDLEVEGEKHTFWVQLEKDEFTSLLNTLANSPPVNIIYVEQRP